MEAKDNFKEREAEILDYVTSNYWIKEFLGKGGFCYVLRVADKKTKTEHALKFMNNLAHNCYPGLLEEEAVRLEQRTSWLAESVEKPV